MKYEVRDRQRKGNRGCGRENVKKQRVRHRERDRHREVVERMYGNTKKTSNNMPMLCITHNMCIPVNHMYYHLFILLERLTK